MQTKHTETPWSLSHPQGKESDYCVRRENLGADIFYHNDYTQQAPSYNDAAFIVKAINNHEKLVEFIRDFAQSTIETADYFTTRDKAQALLTELEAFDAN